MNKTCLITGAAGFIGFHLARELCRQGWRVTGIDNLNDYYDVDLKKSRLAQLKPFGQFSFEKIDLVERGKLDALFRENDFDVVVHLAAQAGVRYSLENPHAYIESNLVGFANILEGCRHSQVKHLVFASSSSVYGMNSKTPFSVHDNVDHPVSLYAASKKANELMAHAYSHLYGLPCTGLRFFTVYGPWGRPDMAYFSFTKAILEGKPIDVYNYGKMMRDFTYVDDIVSGVIKILDVIPKPDPGWNREKPQAGTSYAAYRIYNIGNNAPVDLMRFIDVLEEKLGKKAIRNLLPMQPGDVPVTCADIADLQATTGFSPSVPIEDGLERFVAWYQDYYRMA